MIPLVSYKLKDVGLDTELPLTSIEEVTGYWMHIGSM